MDDRVLVSLLPLEIDHLQHYVPAVLTGPTETRTIPTFPLASLSQYLNLEHC
jgi:hypothetical protein